MAALGSSGRPDGRFHRPVVGAIVLLVLARLFGR
jgi:hypothetical protein